MLRSFELYISFLVWKAKTFIFEGNNMKKFSSFLVLMLIALMLFVSCNNSTPTKEIEEATDEEKSLFMTFYMAAIAAILDPEASGADVTVDPSTGDYVATFNNIGKPGNIVLNGEVRITKGYEKFVLNLGKGTEFKGKQHTIYAEAKPTKDEKLSIVSLNLDGKKLKISDPISFSQSHK